MMHVLILEPDRVVGKCMKEALLEHAITSTVVSKATDAVSSADLQKPDVVITELSLGGHSGTEFIYELRTYPDWQNIPLIIYSTVQPQANIVKGYDWQKMNIDHCLYKPHCSMAQLVEIVESYMN